LIQARANSRIEGLPGIHSQPLEDWANGLIDGAEAERRIIAKYKRRSLSAADPTDVEAATIASAELRDNRRLRGIDEVIKALDGDHLEALRFLLGKIDELEGITGLDALRNGRLDDVLAVLEARSYGSFS